MTDRIIPLMANQIEADRVIGSVQTMTRRAFWFGFGQRLFESSRRCSSTEERGDSKPRGAGSTPATAAKGQG